MTRRPSLAESTRMPPKSTVTPSAPPASAVTAPTRKPPNAVAKTTAGKYGVKNTSGRSRARAHRTAVAKARQDAANPMLKGAEGRDAPCQPRRNSSINLSMRHITSADRRIQNRTGTGPRYAVRDDEANLRGAKFTSWKASPACVVPSGRRYFEPEHWQSRTTWD